MRSQGGGTLWADEAHGEGLPVPSIGLGGPPEQGAALLLRAPSAPAGSLVYAVQARVFSLSHWAVVLSCVFSAAGSGVRRQTNEGFAIGSKTG